MIMDSIVKLLKNKISSQYDKYFTLESIIRNTNYKQSYMLRHYLYKRFKVVNKRLDILQKKIVYVIRFECVLDESFTSNMELSQHDSHFIFTKEFAFDIKWNGSFLELGKGIASAINICALYPMIYLMLMNKKFARFVKEDNYPNNLNIKEMNELVYQLSIYQFVSDYEDFYKPYIVAETICEKLLRDDDILLSIYKVSITREAFVRFYNI